MLKSQHSTHKKTLSCYTTSLQTPSKFNPNFVTQKRFPFTLSIFNCKYFSRDQPTSNAPNKLANKSRHKPGSSPGCVQVTRSKNSPLAVGSPLVDDPVGAQLRIRGLQDASVRELGHRQADQGCQHNKLLHFGTLVGLPSLLDFLFFLGGER